MLRLLGSLTKTVSRFGLAVLNVGMLGPLRAIGRMSRGITRGLAARAAAKRDLEGPVKDLWLVVGLGNPGARYDGTRHNVGFMAVDEVARQNSIPLKKAKANAQVGLGKIAGETVMIVKPLTFMNLSGESVGKISRYYKVPRQRVLVIYDDLDLPNAQVKLKLNGGHGGHNGMRSIIEHFGGKKDFPRLKIGIGRPSNPRITIVKHVLQRFAREEKEDIDFAVQNCVKVVESVMANGMDKALSTVNQKKKKNKSSSGGAAPPPKKKKKEAAPPPSREETSAPANST
ncbi:peptidyl-tRNA hydrolase [Chloropicon primus]|uniref:peptidyl-tRNA hydrolase n=2 Tax=Chloropicon primus TaxID=1764295 RepID=A0A5B8MTQ7_9CHLO|nr:peptidyl-tRNA hydrolase [Chloropicon primus]UPR02358.1 peptidyl-tRNA hydrolase [Chloropicon primus]|eukprot:QDZ23144.1 peptidyl-tRNA hydrolase [Chloropicon primus]